MSYKLKPPIIVIAAVILMLFIGLACDLPGSSDGKKSGDEFAAVEAAAGAQENTGIHVYSANVSANQCNPGYHTGDDIVEKHLVSENAAVIESPDGDLREYRNNGNEFCRTNSQGKVECVAYKSSGYQMSIYESSDEQDPEDICYDSYYSIVAERNSLAVLPVETMPPAPVDTEETGTEEAPALKHITIEDYVEEAMFEMMAEEQLSESVEKFLTDQIIICLNTVFPEGTLPVDTIGVPVFDEVQETAYFDSCGHLETSLFFPHLIGDWVVEEIEVLTYVDSAGEEMLEPIVDLSGDPFLKVLAAYGVFLVEEDDSPNSMEGLLWRWYQTEDFPAGWEGMVIYAHAMMLELDEGATVNLYYWIEYPEAQTQLPGSTLLAGGPYEGSRVPPWTAVLFLPLAVILVKVRPGKKGILVGILVVALVGLPLLSSCDALQGFRGMIETNYNFPLAEGIHLGGGKLVLPDGQGEITMSYFPPGEEKPVTEVYTVTGIGLLKEDGLFTVEDLDSLME